MTATLTPSQRLHLDVYGYVVIEETLSSDETAGLVDLLYGIEEDFHANGPIRAASRDGETGPPGHFYSGQSREFFRVDNIAHLDRRFLDYVANPRLVAMAEEAIGGAVRLEQSDAHIVRPPTDPVARRSQEYGFHRGTHHGTGFVLNGLYYAPFVKTLTNLTDLGPDDGGTTVIAGSHKLEDAIIPGVIAAALDDPKRTLLHHVEAPAGSTLLFYETLVHSSGINISGRDRLLIIAGYTAPMFQPWQGYDPPPELAADLTEDQCRLLYGLDRYAWSTRPVSLTPTA